MNYSFMVYFGTLKSELIASSSLSDSSYGGPDSGSFIGEEFMIALFVFAAFLSIFSLKTLFNAW